MEKGELLVVLDRRLPTFREEVRKGWRGDVKGPFNVEARATAGMSPEFYENLRGDLGAVQAGRSEAPTTERQAPQNVVRDEIRDDVATR